VEDDGKIASENKFMATTKNRKNYQPEFKAKVALEAVRGRLTINEISKQFGVHPASDFQMEKAVSRINSADF
jgi:transposase-like protein